MTDENHVAVRLLLTRNELMFLADISNPGSIVAHAGHRYCGWANALQGGIAGDAWLANELRADAAGALRVNASGYSRKWEIDSKQLTSKLEALPDGALALVARAIARFWDHCNEPDGEPKLFDFVAE